MGADKTARTCTGEQLTPLTESTWLPITQDGLVDAIDTCRIFEDSLDFWDHNGYGWSVLEGVVDDFWDRNSDGSSVLEGVVDYFWESNEVRAEFYCWFVQFSSPDIKAYYDEDWVSYLILHMSPEMFDYIGLLLELGPPGAIDDKAFGRTLAGSIISGYPDKARILLAWGADPHRSSFYYESNRTETPLSLTMYSSWAFCSFRDILYEMNPHIEDIVRRELEQGGPLLEAGWQAETLSALLKLDFEPGTEPPIPNTCASCGLGLYRGSYKVAVQPYWQDILERVKNRTYVQNSCSDTQDGQSPSSNNLSTSTNDSITNTTNGNTLSDGPALPDDQSNQSDEEPVITEIAISRLAPGKEEIWCLMCWLHFKDTGRLNSPHINKTYYSDGDDSSEANFSPFLFNT